MCFKFFIKIIFVCFIGLSILEGTLICSWGETVKPIILSIELLPTSKVVYKLNDKTQSLANLYESLCDIIITYGRDAPISVLFHEDVMVSTLINIRGVIHKVGFGNIRYFHFQNDKKMLAEITIDHPVILYSDFYKVIETNKKRGANLYP